LPVFFLLFVLSPRLTTFPYTTLFRSICDSEEESNLSNVLSFTTSCAIAGLPYIQDFEDITPPEIPACDTAENLGGGNGWVTSSDEYDVPEAFEGNFLFANYSNFLEGDLNAWYYTQGIELEADTEYVISFKYGNNSSSYTEKLRVMFGTSPEEDSMEEEIIDLNNISDGEAHDAEHFF